MIARFFVDRPVFAWVIALGIALAGLMALRALPIEQYPTVAPPSLTIGVTYPGADAQTLEQNATQIIEQELNGVEGFLYMASTSQSNGTATITLTFQAGTDLDVAQTEVQNRLTRVEQRLPEEVRRQGIIVNKASSGFLMIVALTSKSGTMSALELGNVANTQILDELRRVKGVGDLRLFGSEYAMRIWLDPDKLANFNLSAAEALAAVQEQNSQTAGGQIGDQPIAKGAELNATIVTQNRFTNPEQFENIILRANPDGSTVRLADVGRVELGAQSYVTGNELSGRPMAGIAVQTVPGANALATSEGVRAQLKALEKTLPADVAWSTPYQTAPFITASVDEVVKTLIEAMVLVFIVMFLFLQNWRATVIPTLVVPIALAGACLGLWVFGFSINVLSLFGMVLAIGILVDDAIVVIENVERIMAEEHLAPREATIKAMDQITGAIIGITLVLMAVFVPMAFFPGSTGGIYRQFSITLVVSIAFSALLALTLTPALCAALLKPHEQKDEQAKPGRFAFATRFFGWFNGWFGRTTDRYQRGVGSMLGRPLRWLAVFLVLLGLTGFLFTRVPGGFLPTEDQGYLISVVQAPPGATLERTNEALNKMKAFFAAQPQVEDTVLVRGFSFFGQGQNAAMMFTTLHPWEDRKGKDNSAEAMVGKAMGALGSVPEAMIFALSPPPIQELGNASGFTFKLQDRESKGNAALMAARNQLLGMAGKSPILAGVRPEGMEDAPQLRVLIDRVTARALGLSIADVNATLSIAFGSAYANDFNRDGRVLRVLLQADAPFRMTPEDVLNLRVRNTSGQMVPFSAFTRASWTSGPPQLQRYNGYSSATISGTPAPGHSTGEALNEMERLAGQLPGGFTFEWTGTAFEEREAGGQVAGLLGLSIIVVFLLLAALYESWTVPIAVLLVVPLGVLGAVLFTTFRGLSADVYFNVGLITIIGLAAKNAILIVEFAIEREAEGESVHDATMEAVKLRLRPIIMTSLAFILGMVPLVIATGAGAASRRAVGTGVMGGMITATLFGIFFIPVFYIAVRRWLTRKQPHATGHGGKPDKRRDGGPDERRDGEPPRDGEPAHA
ncbi:efflux RND transporter permease subunit [Sphingomonas profundi]|uniref:efflux RND transporter permease subunit n=1 Tax=Alterirhizorhabdus profundi TaxID=2681549 RepID=UPI0024117058|nr:efflux RND transporter permease subunit [Sphingomonas profundi]